MLGYIGIMERKMERGFIGLCSDYGVYIGGKCGIMVYFLKTLQPKGTRGHIGQKKVGHRRPAEHCPDRPTKSR